LVNGPVLDPTLVGGGVGSGRKVEGTGGMNEMTNVRNGASSMTLYLLCVTS